MIGNIRSSIKILVSTFISFLTRSKKPITPATLLLVRLDSIGDYILFRNFIEVLKRDAKYEDYKITICGNAAWKELAEYYDRAFVDKFIWVDKKKFAGNVFYRYKKLVEIAAEGYEIAVQPTHSRWFVYGDSVIKTVNANEKIGSSGDHANIKKWEKKISDKYYTRLIPARNGLMFEFYRNKDFFEGFLNKKLRIDRTELKKISLDLRLKLPAKYAVLFIGAGAGSRCWSHENYTLAGKYLHEKHGFTPVVCGSDADFTAGENISAQIDAAVNLCGKITLLELVSIIQGSEIIISNETSVPHIAMASGVKCVVISNGNHLCRFTPYPKEMTDKYYCVYHPNIENDPETYKQNGNMSAYVSKLDINDISPERVIREIDKALGSAHEKS